MTNLFFRVKGTVCKREFCAKHMVCILLLAFWSFNTVCNPDLFKGDNGTRAKNPTPFGDLLRALNIEMSERDAIKKKNKTYLDKNCLSGLDIHFDTRICNIPQCL